MKVRLLLFSFGILSLIACNNDDAVESLNFEDSVYGVVGRWYAESNVDSPLFNMYGEYVFTGDGAIYADEYRRINGYRRGKWQGMYSVSNGNITIDPGINDGGQRTQPLKVTDGLTFGASFHRFSEDYTLTFNRIVGEIVLSVDSTLNVEAEVKQNIEAYTAQQVEIKGYKMLDDAIASVDESGLVTAKLVGVTFLKVETTVGIAVLKISVSDKNYLWHDFSKVLGKSFNEVEKFLGKHYAFKSDSIIRYFYDNLYVDSVDIYRHNNIADSICVSFRKNAVEDDITNYLDERQVFVKDTLSYSWYTDNTNYLLSTYSSKYYKNENILVYTRFDPNWDDHCDDFGLTFEELREKYGLRVTKEGKPDSNLGQLVLVRIKTGSDFVSEIAYYLKPTVYMYHLTVNIDIPTWRVEEYIKKRFFYSNRDGKWQYLRNTQFAGREMFIRVSIADSHSMYYYIEENK